MSLMINGVVSTNTLPVDEQLDYWHDVVCATFVRLNVSARATGPFSGSLATHQLGCLRFSVVDADPQCVTRTPRLIATGEEYVHVGLQCKGEAVVEQDGRQALLRPGDLAFYDTTRPYLLGFRERFEMKVFMLPRQLLGLPEADLRNVSAVAVRGDEGLGRLVAPFLDRLAGQSGSYGEADGSRVAASAVCLLEAVAAERCAPDERLAETAQRSLPLRIRAFINQHLPDPDLSPESIARAHHISVRYLHKLFEGEGTTVHRWIQVRRLEEARHELGRPGRAAATIASIGHRWGFADPAHFSRSFRAVYGMTPREWRELSRAEHEGANSGRP
jgi:AraC-like DNA-binding protein